jgi:hypothetical protein
VPSGQNLARGVALGGESGTAGCGRKIRIDQGSRVVFRNCNSRFGFLCEYCARIYYFDWLAIGLDGIESALEGAEFYHFALSLPSFGATHSVPFGSGDPRSIGTPPTVCECGDRHFPRDEGLRGVPVDGDNYAYGAQVGHNYSIGVHWNATVTALRREWPSLEFLAPRDWQQRRAIHIQGVFRIHEAEMPEPEEVADVMGKVTARGLAGRTLEWGEVYVARVSRRGSPRRERHAPHPGVGIQCAEDAASYCLKAVTSGLPRVTVRNADFVARLHDAAASMRCDRCPEGGGYCAAPCHRHFGFRGHPISMSRPSPTKGRPGWAPTGISRGSQQEARREFLRARGE